MDFLYGAVGGGVAGLIFVLLGVFAIFYFKRVIAERDALQERRLSTLERQFEEHVREDVSKTILAKLETMEKSASERQKETAGRFEVLTAKVDRALQSNEGQERDLKNQREFLANLREDLQSHVKFCNTRVKNDR